MICESWVCVFFQFQTDDAAWEEFGWDDARLVKFNNGRYERAWTGNCVSIGLSFGFIGFARIYKSFQHTPWYPCLMDLLQEAPLPGQFQRDRFNHNLGEHMDGWREFVEAHYYYSRRRDTPFWSHVSDGVEYDVTGTHEVIQYIMNGNGFHYTWWHTSPPHPCRIWLYYCQQAPQ